MSQQKDCEVVIASGNPHKKREIQQRFVEEKLPFRLVQLVNPPSPVESGETFIENALIKAEAFAEVGRQPALADDSGLTVAALGGGPGVYSSRFAARADADWCRETGEDDANILHLLDLLEGVDQRSAAFECVLVLVAPVGALASWLQSDPKLPEGVQRIETRDDWIAVASRGRTTGRIVDGAAKMGPDGRATVARGEEGFGYDPVFVSEELGITFAEASADAKNRVSHRARALEPLIELFRAYADYLAGPSAATTSPDGHERDAS